MLIFSLDTKKMHETHFYCILHLIPFYLLKEISQLLIPFNSTDD